MSHTEVEKEPNEYPPISKSQFLFWFKITFWDQSNRKKVFVHASLKKTETDPKTVSNVGFDGFSLPPANFSPGWNGSEPRSSSRQSDPENDVTGGKKGSAT